MQGTPRFRLGLNGLRKRFAQRRTTGASALRLAGETLGSVNFPWRSRNDEPGDASKTALADLLASWCIRGLRFFARSLTTRI
jgi:hypothetical protein